MEKKKTFIVNVAFYGLILAGVYLLFRFGLNYVLPFIIAFIASALLNRPIRFLMEKFKLKRPLTAILVDSIAFLILAAIITGVGIWLLQSLRSLFIVMPSFYKSQVEPYLSEILSWYSKLDLVKIFGKTFAGIISSTAESIISSLGTYVTSFSMKVVTFVTSVLKDFPGSLMTTLITIIAVFFISMDYDDITAFLERQINEKTLNFLKYLKDNFLGTIGKYLVSYTIILLITFAEVTVLMLIIGIDNAVLISLLISLFDFMPIVGLSTVFIPWIIIDFVAGHYVRAIIIMLGWIIMTVVRNIIEPKIVGTKVGLNSVVALIAMYVGLKMGGILGMFAVPIAIVMLNEMQKSGIVHIYNEAPLEDKEVTLELQSEVEESKED